MERESLLGFNCIIGVLHHVRQGGQQAGNRTAADWPVLAFSLDRRRAERVGDSEDPSAASQPAWTGQSSEREMVYFEE